jgi:AcrR family transcriptional regulator
MRTLLSARDVDRGRFGGALTILFVQHTNTAGYRRFAQQRGRMKSAFANDGLGDPKHAARATRAAGRQMRSRLLDAASRLFKERGLAAVSIADIAATADAFPSQITYYFRTKEALFVEAACRDVLYVARAAEQHAGRQLSPADYTRALVDSVMESDAVGFFVEAMTLTRRRQDLAPLVERTIERLHAEGLRAYAAEMAARGWHSRLDPDTSARRFWTIAIGVTLEGHAMGRSPDDLAGEMLRLLGPQADAPADAARLRVVGANNSAPGNSSAGKEKQP